MSPAELEDFIECNAERADIDLVRRCALVKQDKRWVLCIGETQSDGIFRHVDFTLPDGMLAPALNHLFCASPEGHAMSEKSIREAQGRGCDA